jgi:hypothetical protein
MAGPTIFVAGPLANSWGKGGAAWVWMSWVIGFQRLGFDVFFVEEVSSRTCVDEAHSSAPFPVSANANYFRSVVSAFGLTGKATLICDDGKQTIGVPLAELLPLATRAALLVNISGHLTFGPLMEAIGVKAYVDMDPGYTQLWQAAGTSAARLEGHDSFFTVGENVGTPICPVPVGGVPWRPIRQPTLLADWPVTDTEDRSRFTSVATWRNSLGPIELGDLTFGSKAHEFRKYVALPGQCPAGFELALDIHTADSQDRLLLERHGWKLVDPGQVAYSPTAFQHYVQRSAAEFSVAQPIHAATMTGWFSDRTVRYLSCGKPVVVQDTGFGRTLPVGEGLVGFRTLEEAIAGVEDVVRRYDEHSRAARRLAELYFDSHLVLGRLLDEIGVAR